jgi:hypothetical protein
MRTDFREFIGSGLALAENTWRSLGGSEYHYQFGPVTMTVRVIGDALTGIIDPAISHRRIQKPPSKISGIVYALDAEALGVSIPPEEWPLPVLRREHLQRVHWQPAEGFVLASDESRGIWHLFDMNRRMGIYWIRHGKDLPSWEPGAPLRYFIHWLAFLEGAQLIHAAGLKYDGCGFLITGAGGSGKSTITAAAITAGWQTVGDDFVLVEGTKELLVHAIYDTVKLDGMALKVMPEIAKLAVNPQRPPDDKARIHLRQIYNTQLVASMPVSAIFSLCISNKENTHIEPASKANIMKALAPSTLFLLRTGMQESFVHISALINNLSCYSIELGQDPYEAIDALGRVIQTFRK